MVPNSELPAEDSDTFITRTADNTLVIAGGNERAVLYGVYDILERVGCRWYGPGEEYVPKIKQLKVGHPSEETTNIGALVSKPHLEKVKQYIEVAKEENGNILCGGNEVTIQGYENGYYLEPTVIEVPNDECRVNQEEIFGPVVTIMSFNTEDEVLQMANKVRYGLSATLWTNNLKRTMRLSNQLQAGIVWVNTWMMRDLRTPFGGVKASGVGREGGFEALRFFTEAKNVCIKY